MGYVQGSEVGRLVGFTGLGTGKAEEVRWGDVAGVIGRWGEGERGGWRGTLGAEEGRGKGNGQGGVGVLGLGWRGWVEDAGGGGGIGLEGGSEDEGDKDEDGQGERRREGWIGRAGRMNFGRGGGFRAGARRGRGVREEEEDDWD